MNESPSFFSDPKVILSLLALIISILALIWTLANQAEQNRRGEKLNAANPEVKEIKMTNYKEVSRDEAQNTIWGYNPDIYAKGEATNIFFLPYFLSIHDSTTNERLKRANPVYTVAEVEAELIRIGHTNNVMVFKHFRPKFIIENMGKTAADKLSVKIEAKLPEQEWEVVFPSSSKMTLAGGQGSTVFFDFELPFNIELPKQIRFRTTLNWQDIHSKTLSKIHYSKWTTADNFWSYDNAD